MSVLLKNAHVVLPYAVVQTNLLLQNGRIAAIGDNLPNAEQTLDLTGLHILPGVIDTQVHLREPGLTHKEDLHTGSKAAVANGVTAVFEMPNTNPNTTTVELLQQKLQAAQGRMYCHHAFYMGATGSNPQALLATDALQGCAGVKVFMGSSTGTLLVDDDARLAQVLGCGRRVVAVHAEDEAQLLADKHIGADVVTSHPQRRSVQAALKATQRVIAAARAANRRIHILHVSTAEEAALLAHHKDIATMELTINHLTLAAPECYERFGTLAQMNPPVRDAAHQQALWQAVNNGTVDIVATDHAPHTPDEKAKPYPTAPSGIAGLESLLPLMLHHVHQQRMSLLRAVDLLATAPQRVFGLVRKGRIAVGYDADLAIVDLNAPYTLHTTHSKAAQSPYDGMTITGRPMMTFINGVCTWREGDFLTAPAGAPLHFYDAYVGRDAG